MLQSCLLHCFNIQYSNEYGKCRENFLSLVHVYRFQKYVSSVGGKSFFLCIIRFQNLMLPPNTRNAPFALFPSFLILCFYIVPILLRSHRCMLSCLRLIMFYVSTEIFFSLCFKTSCFHLTWIMHTFDFFPTFIPVCFYIVLILLRSPRNMLSCLRLIMGFNRFILWWWQHNTRILMIVPSLLIPMICNVLLSAHISCFLHSSFHQSTNKPYYL